MNSKREWEAVILVGGLGTRLRPITNEIPKPMVPINGKPFLEYKLESLKKFGVKKFILCVGYLGNKIEEYFGNGERFGVEIKYSYEKELLGTAGAIKNAEDKITSDSFIVTNGDTFLDLNFDSLISFHETNKPLVSMAITKASNPLEQELIHENEDNSLTFYLRDTPEHNAFLESNPLCFTNAGTYIFDKKILDLIPKDKKVSLENEIFPYLLGGIRVFRFEGYIKDLANKKFCEEFEKDILEIQQKDKLIFNREKFSIGNISEKKTILITGVGGMMGSHMVDFLISKGHKVVGIDFVPTTDVRELNKDLIYIECDIRLKEKLYNIISKFKPEIIFHLAAQSFPSVSWDRPQYTLETNVLGTMNLFEIVKDLNLDTVILNAGTSAEYGFVKQEEVPVKEERELKPLHPYGVSKVAQELLAYQYYKNFGIKSVTIRIFNTTGPKKINDVCSDFTKQIVLMEKGYQKPVLRVGNINTRRAITDVRDMIEAFWLAVHKCDYGEKYNVSGEKIYLIKDIIELLKELTSVQFELFQDPALIRPTDEPIIYGDSKNFKEKTGWYQKIELKKTLQDMLDYWRKKL